MLEKSVLLKGPQGYTVKERGSERLFLNPATGAWFRTNTMGAYILQTLLDGRNSVEDVLRFIAGEYGMTEGDVEGMLMPFLNDALQNGMCTGMDTTNNTATPHEPLSQDTKCPCLVLPSELWIHPHARCNLHCPYCYNYEGASSVKDGSLEVDDLRPLVEYIKANLDGRQKLSIVISGGEPMLWFDKTLEIVRYIKESGISYRISLLSNGTTGSEDDWRQVLSLIDTVQFALDGSNPEINDRIRGKGSFDKTVGTIKMVRSIAPEFKIHLRFAVTSNNCSDMVSFLGLASDLRVDHLTYCNVYPHGRGQHYKELQPSETALTLAMNDVKRAYQVLRVTGQCGKLVVSPGNLDPMVNLVRQCRRENCGAGSQSLLIAENGNIYPCVSMQAPEFLLGNIRRDAPNEILACGKGWADQCTVDTIQVCKDCEYRYVCGGTCKASNWHMTGSVKGLDHDRIDVTTGKCKWRDAIEERMWNYPDYATQRKRLAAYAAMQKNA